MAPQPDPDRGANGLYIKVLGPVEVLREDGIQVPLEPLLRRVLAALAQRPRQVVSVSRLVDDIWPGLDDRLATRRLYTAIWKLRTRLATASNGDGRQLIRWIPPGYLLDVTDDQLDWTRFRRLRMAGTKTLRGGAPSLAKSYLSAALGLWAGTESLSGLDVGTDDLAFVTERAVGRASATRDLITAHLELGEYGEVIPRLEAYVELDPLDESAVSQLAVAYYQQGHLGKALSTFDRHFRLIAEIGLEPSGRIRDLQAKILRRDPVVQARSQTDGHGSWPVSESILGHHVFLSSMWAQLAPSTSGPLPAELHLLVEEHSGDIHAATESSVDASFSEFRAAFETAAALQRTIGRPPFARVGIHLSDGAFDPFKEPPRVRVRLLAQAAHSGQVLVAGTTTSSLQDLLPDRVRLEELGDHRLTALTPLAPIFQLKSSDLPDVRASPRWFDRGVVKNLAEDPFRFVGREREAAEVTRCLSKSRLVTLVGAPGSGKTRLAAHVAAGLSHKYRDGSWFVDLSLVSQSELIVSTVVDVLQTPRSSMGDPIDALLRFLGDRQLLLVLDNCEHLLDECRDVVNRLLGPCPEVSVLATSREALRSRLELVVSVPPLEPPPPGSTEATLANPAVQLFYDRLHSARSGRGMQKVGPEDEVEAVARICRAVEGLPLTLVLAAARAHELGTRALADLLEEGLDEGSGLNILAGREEHAEPSRHTLYGTMEWSYRLLGARDRLLFESLSVFRSVFTLEDANAVCGKADLSHQAILIGLERLLQVSLLNLSGNEVGQGRFRMLQPVRDFASAKLAARGDQAGEVHRRHAEHFLAIAEDADSVLRGPQDPATLQQLEERLHDLRAAFRWAVAAGEGRMALRTVRALWVFWYMRGGIVEGRKMTESALALDPSPSEERVKALVVCSHLSWLGGDLQRTREVSREALRLIEAIGGDWGWAWVQLGLAGVEVFNSADPWVPLRLEEALLLFRRLGNDWDTGFAIEVLGNAAFQRGDYTRAERALSESLGVFRSLGHPTLMASLLAHGLMLALLGHLDAGAAEVDQSIEGAYEASDLVHLAWALCHRAAIARYGRNNYESRRYYLDALRVAREAGNGWAIEWALDGLGNTEELGLDVSSQRIEGAVYLLAKAEAIARETGLFLAPREREYHARDLERARDLLGEPDFRVAFARGERLSLDEAIDLAISLDEPSPQESG